MQVYSDNLRFGFRRLRPDVTVRTLDEVTPQLLQKSTGIEAVLVDIDDTLHPDGKGRLPKASLAMLKRLSRDFKVALVTNNMRRGFCRKIQDNLRANGLNIPLIFNAWKPDPAAIRMLQARFAIPSWKTALIGDSRLTDVLAARRERMMSIRIKGVGQPFRQRWVSHFRDSWVWLLTRLHIHRLLGLKPQLLNPERQS